MPSSSNLTPALRCPQCQQTFRIPLDRMGLSHMCDSCCCALQVTRDQAGHFVVREEAAAAGPTAPAPQTAAPAVATPAAVAGSSADRTMMGKPAAPAAPSAPGVPARSAVGKPATAAPARPSADQTMVGKPAAPAAGAAPADPNRTAVGKPVAAPTNGRAPAGHSGVRSAVRRSAAPAAGQSSMAARAVTVRPPSSAARAFWLVVAVAAFVVPVAGASGLVVYKWVGARGRGTAAVVPQPPSPTPPPTPGKRPPIRYGGIEIGSSGVKPTVVEVFSVEGIDYDYHLVGDYKSKDTKIITGLDKNLSFDADALEDTVNAVQSFFQAMTKDGLPKERIFIVGSSGLFKALRNRKDLRDDVRDAWITKNQQALSDRVLKATGQTMDFISVKQEVPLLIKGLVQPQYLGKSVLIDVGTGAARGGYLDDGGDPKVFEILGAGTFESKVKPNMDESFPEAARRAAEAELRVPLQEQMRRLPGLLNADRVYFNGGTAWVMATLLHPEERGPYVQLSAADIDSFRELMSRNPDKFDPGPPPAGLDAATQKDVAAEMARMQKIFNPHTLIAGAEVLEALSAELHFRDKKLFFTRGGDIGWLLSYIGDRYLKDSDAAAK